MGGNGHRGVTCGWRRWWHRRLRTVDLDVFWPTLLDRAESVAEARVAWDVFIRQPGQEHWRCACGAPLLQLFPTVYLVADETTPQEDR
jgi:hypothetical protein